MFVDNSGLCYFLLNQSSFDFTGEEEEEEEREADCLTSSVLMGSCCSAQNNPNTAIPPGEPGNDSGRSPTRVEVLRPSCLKIFCFKDLEEATRSFHDENKLGRGKFGHVYKGWIDDESLKAAQPETGTSIAVKKLDQQGSQGLPELVAEIRFLGQFCHPNLVKLIGYCSEGDQPLLVYEFMPRGSLEKHLYRSDSSCRPLSWNLRMKIAIGTAEGLAFLHEAGVIYRDLKSSDVLLDLHYNAKLSDFGLAKDAPTEGRTHVSTRPLGTEGYSAPEYMGTGHLTVKSDVYSFGVVFLELISGKQSLDKARPPGEQRLVEWARPHLSSTRTCLQVLDSNILKEVEDKYDAMQKTFKLAVRCLSTDPRLRPNMKEVVKVLTPLYDPTEK